MAKTKKANWEKIVLLLKGNGATDLEINATIKDATTNKEKEAALVPLQEKYHVSLKKNAEKYPTIQEYFGKVVADLLVRRKEILTMKKINIKKFSKKSLEELTIEEQRQYLTYLQNQEQLKELEDIDNKLVEKGLIITDKKKEYTKVTTVEKKPKKKVKETSKEKEAEKKTSPEEQTIQF